MGWRQVHFELDSEVVMRMMIHLGCNNARPCSAIMGAIRLLMDGSWNIKLSYCFREANKMADRMAFHAHELRGNIESMIIFNDLPTFRREELNGNFRGVCFLRMCIS